jgi:hypothetical protein
MTIITSQNDEDTITHDRSPAGYSETHAKRYAGQRNGTTWTTEVINVLWDNWAVVWASRNAAIHGHDEATRSQQRDRLNRQRLEAIYEAKMEMEPRIRELLYEHSRRAHATLTTDNPQLASSARGNDCAEHKTRSTSRNTRHEINKIILPRRRTPRPDKTTESTATAGEQHEFYGRGDSANTWNTWLRVSRKP